MYHHVANCRGKALLKQSLSVFLIFTLYFNFFSTAYASTVGGWTIGGLVADGASSVVNASKTIVVNGANVVKTSTARITPSVVSVAKVLRGGAAGYALSIAVEQILGSVDWLLDPANNRIVYTSKPDPSSVPNLPFYYQISVSTTVIRAATISSVCSSAIAQANNLNNGYKYVARSSDNTTTDDGYCGVNVFTIDGTLIANSGGFPYSKVINHSYNEAEEEEKSISLDTVAAQVITNADTNPDSDKKAGSQVATTTAAQDLLNNDSATQSDVENQLNTNARTNTAEGANEATGETKPNVADPTKTDLSLSFPAFCGWAPTICEAAQAAINFPQTVSNWWSKAVLSFTEAYAFAQTKVSELENIFKNEPEQNTELEFNDPTNDVTDTNITFSRQCPAPIVLADFSYHGISQNWQVDFTGWCNVFSSIFKPIVIAMASFSAVLIVSGVRENG
jgi:hypothetical protein